MLTGATPWSATQRQSWPKPVRQYRRPASWPDNACRSGNEYVTICGVDQIEIREYLDAAGRSLFARWYEKLNATAAARVTISLARLGQANFSNVEGVGGGVYEN